MISNKILAKKLFPLWVRELFKAKARTPSIRVARGFYAQASCSSFSTNSNRPNFPNNNFFESDSSDSDKNVFVSRHYTSISNDMILNLMNKFHLEPKLSSSTGQISAKFCPFCKKPHNYKRDNMYTLQVKPSSGAFFCFRCGIKGSWFDLKNLLYDNTLSSELVQMKYTDQGFLNDAENIASPVQPSLTEAHSNVAGGAAAPPQQLKKADEAINFIRFNNLLNNKVPETLEYLKGRGFVEETLRKYKIGIGYDNFFDEQGNLVEIPVVYFPMFMPKSKKEVELSKDRGDHKSTEVNVSDWKTQLVRVKVRGVGKKLKRFQKLEPAPGYWGMFGLNTVPFESKEIVITEGEFDAMAVHQATGLPAISLPNGASHIPLQVLPMLEKYEKIYLWMDADEAGKLNAPKIAEKLGINRTFIVNTTPGNEKGPKDANDALLEDPASLSVYIKKAKSLNQENLLTFENLREGVLNRILKYEQNVGIKSTFLSFWNKKLKGFRRGEFTILTGITGSGKTTLLSQLALDFCKNGVPTLMGSFELKNEILATSMLMQLSYTNLVKEPQKFEYYASEFEKMNMKFMNFFGSTNLEKILSTIEFAVYAYDIAHVIIDNLQFLLSGQGRGIEKFEIQDEAISKFRELATRLNVHVTLVIHPRKVDEDQDLNLSSIFGSAKVSQEADNVLILQSRRKYKILELKKNRFDGEMGAVALGFDRECKRYFELYQNEVILLDKRQDTIEDIIAARRQDKKADAPDGEFFSYFDMQEGPAAKAQASEETLKRDPEAKVAAEGGSKQEQLNVAGKGPSDDALATENFLERLKEEERERQITKELEALRANDKRAFQKPELDHNDEELLTEEVLEAYLKIGGASAKAEKKSAAVEKPKSEGEPSEYDSTIFNSHELNDQTPEGSGSSPYDMFLSKNKEKVDSFFSSKDKVIDESTKARLLKTASQGGMDTSSWKNEPEVSFKSDEVFYDKMNIESHASRRKKPYFKKQPDEN